MSQRIPALLGLFIVAGACASVRTDSGATASAGMRLASGAPAGTLRLERTSAGVRVTGRITGLQPGAHGIHFHAMGRCDAPDFATAGPHFNPAGRQHGLANSAGPHAGDMPAIAADATGAASVDFTTVLVTLDAATATGLLDADGTAIVVHAANDDQVTDPSGNSGARIACGLVAREASP